MPKRSVFGSLSFRVLVISFFLVILPLILYSIYVYTTGYHEKVHDLRTDVSLFKEDKINSIHELEKNYLDFLFVLQELTDLMREQTGKIDEKKLMPIFQQFAKREDISALFYLDKRLSQGLVCTFSTEQRYKGVDFASYFSENDLRKKTNGLCSQRPCFWL